MNSRRLSTPWARPCDVYSVPSSVIVKLRLGEAPEHIEPVVAVRAGIGPPAGRTGIRPLDHLLWHFSDGVRIARVHAAACTAGAPGHGRLAFDDLEHATGIARTFEITTDDSCSIGDLIDALRMLHVVEAASPQYVALAPFAAAPPIPDPTADLGWPAREQVNGPQALAYEPGDPALVVGIVDTGIVTAHAELGPNIRHLGPDEVELGSGDLAPGLELLGDTSGRDLTPADEVGHGSGCAGIIGARGLAIPPGLAGACTVQPARVLGSVHMAGRPGRFGVGRIADIDRGVKRLTDMGAKVMNLSFGTPLDALDPEDAVPHLDVVRYALARGCVLVAASGNSGDARRYTPACLAGVIAVGAAGDDGRPCAFSAHGPHVALAAPGVRVVSVGLDGYATLTGTSFAAPFVAAAAALLASRARRRGHELDGRAVRDLLTASAQPWPTATGPGHGAGVLDALAALEELDRRIDSMRGP